MMANDDLLPLIDGNTTIKVSSTLEKATGKKNLIDDCAETCWTSQQGLPQFIQLTFKESVTPKCLSITFQGGFVGTRCAIFTSSDKTQWQPFATVYPEDVNRRQIFNLEPTQQLESGITTLKLVFESSSDFFGRITIYDLKLYGIVKK